ncbi:hypothetical protein ACFUN8_21835 [Streptomyces sp. NPDC057307]|uniref:hypothetical protein n=1 Tax=Streptomyces sp. NPDC057307 TaxID=3346096 RepID=UPI00362B3A71
MRRWVKVSVVAAAVLGLGGYLAAPSAQEWLLVRQACDGALPRDALKSLTPADADLKSAESKRTESLGSYSCSLTFDGHNVSGERTITMSAYTRRDDQDRAFMAVFSEEGFDDQAPLPGSLPGFVDQYGSIRFLVSCPDLGKDGQGRQRKLMVQTYLGQSIPAKTRSAAYRIAAAFANSASDKVGCGAEAIEPPKKDLPRTDAADDVPTVPVAEAGDTACAWVSRAGLPEGGDWRIRVGANSAAPTGRCELLSGSDDESWRDGSRLAFVSWYGDWSNRLTAYDNDGIPRSGTASARCDGEAANYALSATPDIPGVDAAAKERMFKEFARDEVRRHGCSGLRFHS